MEIFKTVSTRIRTKIGERMFKEDELRKDLKQIRKLLAAEPAPPPPPPKGLWNEFKDFLGKASFLK
jgi:hypothetical protein